MPDCPWMNISILEGPYKNISKKLKFLSWKILEQVFLSVVILVNIFFINWRLCPWWSSNEYSHLKWILYKYSLKINLGSPWRNIPILYDPWKNTLKFRFLKYRYKEKLEKMSLLEFSIGLSFYFNLFLKKYLKKITMLFSP